MGPMQQLAGNQPLKEQLLPRIEAGTLSHACILSGPEGVGKHTLARILAAAMVCSGAPPRPCGGCPGCRKVYAGVHPDVSILSGEGDKPISVDQVRALRADAYIRPNEAPAKVYIVEGADRMNPSAQNAMLKLLEEGPAYAAFFLLAENAGGVLPTIRSRCEQLPLLPVSLPQAEQWLAEHFPDRPLQARRQAALECQGILGRAQAILSGDGEDEELEQQARSMADACFDGDEAALSELCTALEKWERTRFSTLLDRMAALLSQKLADPGSRRAALKAMELLDTLKLAAGLNVGPGTLSGWLCAALFTP